MQAAPLVPAIDAIRELPNNLDINPVLVTAIDVQHRETGFCDNKFVPLLKSGIVSGLFLSGDIHEGSFFGERPGSGEGEREASMTRQMPFEPLPASVSPLFGGECISYQLQSQLSIEISSISPESPNLTLITYWVASSGRVKSNVASSSSPPQ